MKYISPEFLSFLHAYIKLFETFYPKSKLSNGTAYPISVAIPEPFCLALFLPTEKK